MIISLSVLLIRTEFHNVTCRECAFHLSAAGAFYFVCLAVLSALANKQVQSWSLSVGNPRALQNCLVLHWLLVLWAALSLTSDPDLKSIFRYVLAVLSASPSVKLITIRLENLEVFSSLLFSCYHLRGLWSSWDSKPFLLLSVQICMCLITLLWV